MGGLILINIAIVVIVLFTVNFYAKSDINRTINRRRKQVEDYKALIRSLPEDPKIRIINDNNLDYKQVVEIDRDEMDLIFKHLDALYEYLMLSCDPNFWDEYRAYLKCRIERKITLFCMHGPFEVIEKK
ncbi:hypothetical protein [Leptospira johnsonii]|uniref:Uncharacterized protein n=1 Tax=Leptospira johnsonii TaxID=1917820 RepID=A0A2P2D7Q0_9LEPT|nr:hypothetical protein [Leptospira johnsonii]GBF40650.1 hypothetical protein LPTSP1_36680 [Leptospira johnsonii]